jgi:hypothetical protein
MMLETANIYTDKKEKGRVYMKNKHAPFFYLMQLELTTIKDGMY